MVSAVYGGPRSSSTGASSLMAPVCRTPVAARDSVTEARREAAGRDRTPTGRGDPDDRLALVDHRLAVLVPVRVLAADVAEVLHARVQRLRHVQHLRVPVDLHPRAVPLVGEHD